MDFEIEPPTPVELNSTGILPVCPGWICLSHEPVVVQPHEGRTSRRESNWQPVLVKKKSQWIIWPESICPKLKVCEANSTRGPEGRSDVPAGPGTEAAEVLTVIAVAPLRMSAVVTTTEETAFIHR